MSELNCVNGTCANDFNCILEGCSEVLYQVYESPKVRWKYPNEEWQEAIADNYKVETLDTIEDGKCPGVSYVIKWWVSRTWAYNGQKIQDDYFVEYGAFGQIYDYWVEVAPQIQNPNSTATYFNILAHDHNGDFRHYRWFNTGSGIVITPHFSVVELANPAQEIPEDCEHLEDPCLFEIYKDGVTIHSQVAEFCPEVEKFDCKKSEEVKIVRIKKLPGLQKTVIVNKSFEQVFHGVGDAQLPFIKTTSIPDECLNIYSAFITTSSDYPDDGEQPGLNPWRFIAQMCSGEGCPPPVWGITCRDDCEPCTECPEGTCAVDCGDHICCHDETGKALGYIDKVDACLVDTEFHDTRGLTDEFA